LPRDEGPFTQVSQVAGVGLVDPGVVEGEAGTVLGAAEEQVAGEGEDGDKNEGQVLNFWVLKMGGLNIAQYAENAEVCIK
jgi:hypothetical protein